MTQVSEVRIKTEVVPTSNLILIFILSKNKQTKNNKSPEFRGWGRRGKLENEREDERLVIHCNIYFNFPF